MAFGNVIGNSDGSANVILEDADGDTLQIIDGAVKGVPATVDFTFQNAAAATGTGNEFTVDYYKTLLVEITGTATAQTLCNCKL